MTSHAGMHFGHTYPVTAMRHMVCRADGRAYYFTVSATIWAQVIKPVPSVLGLDATVPVCLRIEKTGRTAMDVFLNFTDLNGNSDFCLEDAEGVDIYIYIYNII